MTFTLKEFCERNKIAEQLALDLVHSGQVPGAFNAAKNPNGKPLWRIPEEGEKAWRQSRAVVPPTAAVPTRRRRKQSGEVNYY